MRINHNISALSAFNSLTTVNNQFSKVIKQVSTGLRINSAADDAAGLAISENLHAQALGLERAVKNAQDGISLLQTAEGALGETNSMLQRMRELAVQAANDTLTSQDRSFIQMEIDELKANIDRVANTTQFNTKRLLDGSGCGIISSTDSTTKGYIRGAIDVEGNYRIEVKANPGEAQVQKSTIFKIKHEDVITNAQTNNGVNKVEAQGMPAGDYRITATKAGGGEIITEYKSIAEIDIEKGNESGVPEYLRFRLTGKTQDGTVISWPSRSSTSPSYDPNADTNNYYSVQIPATSTTTSDIAAIIKRELNGKNITLSTSNGTTTADFSLEVDDDGKITSTSTEGELTSATFLTASSSNINPDSNIRYNYNVTNTDTTYEASIAGKISLAGNASATTSASTITFTISENGSTLGAHPVNIPAGSSVADISSLIQSIDTTIGNIPLKGYNAGSSKYSLTASNGSNNTLQVTASISSSEISLEKRSSDLPASDNNRYIMTHTGTTSFNSGSPRTTSGEEKYKLSLRGITSSQTVEIGEITFDENDTTPDAIAQKVVNTCNNKSYAKLNGVDVLIDAQQNGSSYTITTSNSNEEVYFYFSNTSTPAATSKVNDATFTTSDDGGVAVPSATTSLTGFYGSEEAASSLSANINSKTQNNASILFEVTASAIDSNGNGTITLKAQSNVLTADGKNYNHTDSKIVVSTGNKTVNLGSLLGEDDNNFSITLDPEKFNIGDKFVYSISGNGTSSAPADTSLYINCKEDTSWPQSWENLTYKNNELYYNVNAEAVSNQELHFRNFYLNSETGKVHQGDIALTTNSDFGEAAKNFPEAPVEGQSRTDNEITLASFNAAYVGKIATGATKLRDLEQFWNKSGVFMLERPQTITISQNNGAKTSITLNASDTLNDLRRKLNDAIAVDLGQEIYTSNPNNLVSFVEEPYGENGIESVKGTMLIRSLIPGSAGELTFSSSYGELIDALALNTIKSSAETSYTASVYDAHDGSIIARDVKTTGNVLRGVIHKNIDVEFDAFAGVKANWSDVERNFLLTPEQDAYITHIHVVKNDISFQIGANEEEKITLDIGDMSSAGLGVQGLNVMTRERSSKAITILDNAIKRVSEQRSKIGAYQNSLDNTIESLTVTNENIQSSESRIRDADMSKSMLDLVKFQILNQSSTSMLAQANQLPQSVLSLMQ